MERLVEDEVLSILKKDLFQIMKTQVCAFWITCTLVSKEALVEPFQHLHDVNIILRSSIYTEILEIYLEKPSETAYVTYNYAVTASKVEGTAYCPTDQKYANTYHPSAESMVKFLGVLHVLFCDQIERLKGTESNGAQQHCGLQTKSLPTNAEEKKTSKASKGLIDHLEADAFQQRLYEMACSHSAETLCLFGLSVSLVM